MYVTDWPFWLESLVAVVMFGFAVHLQQVLSYAVLALWRLHLVHHADRDSDVTTGICFQTLEVLASAVIKIVVVAAGGLSALAVMLFEVVLDAMAIFNTTT